MEKLANVDLDTITKDVKTYLEAKGVTLNRSFIELDGILKQARIIPMVVKSYQMKKELDSSTF